ncbi:hypothetical protein C8R45DRAFT_947839 [Mycena sanguinolenta]|nr:hypothetical protein C8R45DRAFT_947839 [Mycena sanguinolenta]
MAFLKVSVVLLSLVFSVSSQSQDVFETPKPLWTTFHHPIRRVAVVGAGPAGLQAAAKLIEHNFTVRLFERAPHPGGNWLYSEETPVREPDKPVGQTAEIPAQIPVTQYYNEGDDGLPLDDRWKEHWQPRPLWDSLHINTPNSIVQGIDEIILATGYRGYALFPPNSTTKRPENIHWTGHYIPDPTLAYTFGRPWTLGRYQSYGLAKVWKGSARLPTSEQMKLEEEYWPMFRRYITWLNNASLEHGGRFVEPPPIENIEILKYFMLVYLRNNTINLDIIGNFGMSMLSGQLGDKDAWNALIDEDDDW